MLKTVLLVGALSCSLVAFADPVAGAGEILNAGSRFAAIAKRLEVKALPFADRYDLCHDVRKFLADVSEKQNLWCYAEQLQSLLDRTQHAIFETCTAEYNATAKDEYRLVETADLSTCALKWKGVTGSSLAWAELAAGRFRLNQPEFAYRYFSEVKRLDPRELDRTKFYLVLMSLGKSAAAEEFSKDVSSKVRSEGASRLKESRNWQSDLFQKLSRLEKGWEKSAQDLSRHFHLFPQDCLLLKTELKLPTFEVSQVVARGKHTCVAQENEVHCLGNNQLKEAPEETLFKKKIVALGSGAYHTCAWLEGNEVRCLGSDRYHQAPPEKVFSQKILALSVGGFHTCVALESPGESEVQCFGRHEEGQAPPRVAFGKRKILSLVSGRLHTCVWLAGDELQCFGDNFYGQAPKKKTFSEKILEVAAGGEHTCVLTEGNALRCFGENRDGQAPREKKDFGQPVVSISAGHKHTSVLLKGNEVRWLGFFSGSPIPRTKTFDKKVLGLSSGDNHTCVLLEGREIRCVGDNEDGEAPNRFSPPAPVSVRKIQSLVDCPRYTEACRSK